MFVSWIARSLYEISHITKRTKLCFSHITFFRFPYFFDLLSVLKAERLPLLAPTLKPILSLASVDQLKALHLISEPDSDPQPDMPEKFWRGFNHGHLLRTVVSGRMQRMLAELLQAGRLPGAVGTGVLIKAVLTDEGALIDAIGQLRAVYPNVLQLERHSRLAAVGSGAAAAVIR